jgi:glutamine amidotransferase
MKPKSIKPRISVVNYKAGNLRSVANALTYLEADFFVSGDPDALIKSDKLILPGVGHAGSAMNALISSGIDGMLNEYRLSGRPIFGICLGSQLFLEYSEEGGTRCLGYIRGECPRFPKSELKVPQMGWNSVFHSGHKLFDGIPSGAAYYFVHSYYTAPADTSEILCTTEYGFEYASGLVKDNLISVQFHPERSGKWGLKMLANFLELI